MSTQTIAARVNYQNATNVQNLGSPQPSMDRARGGIIQITLNIPSKRYRVRGGPGAITTDAMSVTIDIDLEQMPLVNVAGYSTDRVQDGPDEIPYPNGVTTYNENFG